MVVFLTDLPTSIALSHHILIQHHRTQLLIPSNMDQLHRDTFGDEHDTQSDALFSQAQQLIRKCPCRRYKNTASRCVRCKLLLAMFAHRPELDDGLPREEKSRLEIVSSRTSGRSEHLAVGAVLSVELGDGGLACWSDDDAEDSDDDVADSTCDAEDTDDDVDGSTYEKKWEERLVRHRRRYARQQDELDWLQWQDAIPRGIEQAQTSDPGDAEDEQVHAMGSPNFSSPALQLVWGRFMSHHQLGILIGQNVTNLRRAALVTFGPSHRRGAAHAVGLWANSDDGSIFFRLGCWIRRQREMLFGLLFDS